MYKLLLCWRYLRTRYIALICIVSVTLGVATLIVVNSVMSGFTHEMQVRLNGVLGDLVVESRSMDGVPNAENHMALIRQTLGDSVVGMSPLVQAPALLYLEVYGADGQPHSITRQVTLLGIDEATYASVSDFGQYLQHPDNREQLNFDLHAGGYDTIDHQADDDANVKPRPQMSRAGWPHRREQAARRERRQAQRARQERLLAGQTGSQDAAAAEVFDPFAADAAEQQGQGEDFDPAAEHHTGIVLGINICSYRMADGADHFHALPGDDVKLSFPKATIPPEAISGNYTIVDFYESKLGEYDSNFVFVPLRSMQESRGLIDPETGIGKFNSIQIKLAEGADINAMRDKLQAELPLQFYVVSTWRDKQGPLLAAVNQEMVLLNVLLFLIIAVAGFGILAIFLMIVVEKTRDIGILKSLGASRYGVMGIFLSYGLSLGVVGSGAGLILGLLFVEYIHEIAEVIGHITGRPVFDPSVYYLPKIPTIIDPLSIAWVMAGAIFIAVLSSVLPALRAANLHPVRALRYE